MGAPDRITHSISRRGRPAQARLRSWKDGRVTSVIETHMRWDHGSFCVSDCSSVVHPAHRDHAEAVLAKVAFLTGLAPPEGLEDDLAVHAACEVVDDGRIVVWAEKERNAIVGHARELTTRGSVLSTDCPFGLQKDRDGVDWMTVCIGIESPFPRRGAIRAMYDAVERASGVEMRPMGWNGMGGTLNDERIYTLWRKRLALKGIDLDDGLRQDTLERTRRTMPQDRRDALDRWVDEAIERSQFEAAHSPR